MSEPIKPGAFQRRIIQLVNFEDGLWDIMLGLIFLALGVFPLTRKWLGPSLNFGLYLAFLAIVVILLQLARKSISAPRIGIVKNLRSKAKIAIITILVCFVFLTLALVVITHISSRSSPALTEVNSIQTESDYSADIILGVVVIVIFSLIGFAFGIRRSHLYGVLIGGGNLVSTFLRHEYGYSYNLPLVLAALTIILIGAYLLLRFVRNYPVASDEGAYADQ
jgi:hypothetical protein